MNGGQEVVLLAAVGVMVVIPPWNATRPKGDASRIPFIETGPCVYRSIFLDPPKIYRSGHEYIPEINGRRLAAQCGIAVLLAAVLMVVLRDKKEQDEWPPRKSKNTPWNAGQG
jgi:hypothetical protein